MEQLNFGKTGMFFLFGGGIRLRNAALILKEAKFRVFVFSSKRFLEEAENSVSLERFLEKNGIGFESTDDINSCKKMAEMLRPDSLGISFGAPWIFKPEFIKKFNNRLLNSHNRNLPRNRGGGGFSWMILNQEKDSASLLHLIDTGLDTGLVIKKEQFSFPEACKIPKDFESHAIKKDKKFFKSFVDDIAMQKIFKPEKQDESKSSYFPRLHSLSQGFVDWAWSKEEIARFIDAFDDPYCGASTYLGKKKFFLKKSGIANDKGLFHPFMAGLVYRKANGKLFIATRNGCITVSEIWDEQGKPAFEKVRLGQRLFTPATKLENARIFHPVYTPNGMERK